MRTNTILMVFHYQHHCRIYPNLKKNNKNVSVNVYGLEKKLQPPLKHPMHCVFPLKVADSEKQDHFGLLLLTDGDNSHYTYISNFSRLLHSQKNSS